ncbi:MAG: dienelactone hydrolase family protein [Thermoplasmata archaeon]
MSSPRPVAIASQGRNIDCHVVFPEGVRGRGPAVVVIHEIFGPDTHILDVAERFATAGYVAIAPNLFTGELQQVLTPANIALAMQAFAQAPPDLRRDPSKFAGFAAAQPPERRPALEAFGRVSSPAVQAGFARDLHVVTEFVRTLPEVDPHRVGSVGFCFGGAMSARLATVDSDLRAAVIFYGQNPPLEDVPAIRAAVLGLYGGEDRGISDAVPAFAEAMQRAGRSFTSHIYPGAKHAFFNDTRPNYDAAAAKDAWPRVLDFFRAHLVNRGPSTGKGAA